VRALWGVGPKSSARFESLGIHTIGDLAREPELNLVQMFGKYGHDLSRHARGIDNSPIELEHDIKSISQEITFDRDVADRERLMQVLRDQVERVAYRLRRDNLTGITVRIKVRWPDFTTQSRQLPYRRLPTRIRSSPKPRKTFSTACGTARASALARVGVSGLQADYGSLLYGTILRRERRLLQAVDELKGRFGGKSSNAGPH